MLLCVQPSCTSMAKTKSVTKGVMIKRVLYDTKKTQVKNISHSALPQKYPLKTMPPRHPRPFSAPTPACTCSLWCCLGCRLGGAVEFARPVANCDLYPTHPLPKKIIENPLQKTKAQHHPPAILAQSPSSYVLFSCFPRF